MRAARKSWTEPELQLLRELYPHMHSMDVAALMDCTVWQINKAAYKTGLHKSAEYLASDISARIQRGKQHPNMIASRLKPGHKPWNKGMKGLYTPGSERGWFKPGQRPHTWLPVGSYRLTKDGYLERKTNDLPGNNSVRWHAVHRLVWIAANGPIPKGHIVAFRPGCKTTMLEDITIDRIECISRAELSRRNHPRSKSPELGRLVQLRGAITRQINKRTRDNTPQPGAAP